MCIQHFILMIFINITDMKAIEYHFYTEFLILHTYIHSIID